MDAIREQDEEMSQQIQDLFACIDKLADVDDRAIQAILREVQQDVLSCHQRSDESLR